LVAAAIAGVGVLATGAGCGDPSARSPTGAVDAAGRVAPDAALAPPPARERPVLGPSELETISVVTGGAAPTDTLPLVIALHGAGNTPEGFAALFDGFEHRARVVLPRGPLKLAEGRAWLPFQVSEDVLAGTLATLADKVAALTDEVAASHPTEGPAIVTGFSQGGLVAFVVATQHPERFRAAVPLGAALPQIAWPDPALFVRDRPVLRALAGVADDYAPPTDVRRGVVKLRLSSLDATVRLYADTGHVVSPAIRLDLHRTLSWLVAGTAEPGRCAPCPGDSVDPEACSLCPHGEPAPDAGVSAAARAPASPGAAAPPAAATAPRSAADGPDLSLDRTALAPRRGDGAASGLSPQQVQEALRRNMAPIRFCHEQRLAARPGLSGRVAIRFTVAPDGAVSGASVDSSTLGDDAAVECVRRAVTRVRFPAPAGGAPVTITYPFLFAAEP
jgi:phospholipase/carboxylesterase